MQRIPIVFAGAAVRPADSRRRMHSVDILPTILREMEIPALPGMDGRALRLSHR